MTNRCCWVVSNFSEWVYKAIIDIAEGGSLVLCSCYKESLETPLGDILEHYHCSATLVNILTLILHKISTNQNVLPKIFCKSFENLGEIKKYEKKIHFDDCSFEFPTERKWLWVFSFHRYQEEWEYSPVSLPLLLTLSDAQSLFKGI